MAISLVSPGIKITEVDQISSAPSVATTTGVFAGQFRWGPIEDPTLVSSEADLVAQFGVPTQNNAVDFLSAANFLSYSQSLYTVRVANTALNAVASGAGTLIKNRDVYENTTSFSTGPWAAKWAGSLGNTLRVSACPSSAAWESTFAATGDPANDAIVLVAGNTTVTGTNTTFTTQMVNGDLLVVSGKSYKVKTVTSNTVLTLEAAPTANASGLVSTSKRRWEFFDLFSAAPGTTTWGALKGASGDEIHVVVVDEDGEFTGVKNNVLEKFASLSKGSDAKGENGGTNFYKDVINQQSKYVWWTGHDAAGTNWANSLTGTTYTTVAQPKNYSLSNGADGGDLTDASRILGYTKVNDKDVYPLSVVIAGQASSTVINSIIADLCEIRKDCVVVASPPRASVVNNAGNETNSIVNWLSEVRTSTYAVLDSGWKYQYNKYTDSFIYVPLNPDVAGCMARNDLNRDPWISPAGATNGRILNVTKLSWNPFQSDRDTLYKYGVNPVITQARIGTVLFGDKTFTTRNTSFNRINVRRLFIELEKTISSSAASSVLFEQNDAATRTNFVNLISPYLKSVQARRGISDFKVVCDQTNNPDDVVNNNEFICDIFVKPTRSVNFIQLNFVAVRGTASFTEVA